MATYKQIEDANAKLKSTEIKGKAYMEVNQRIKAFRMVYPEGFITTEMISNENGVCIFRAKVGAYGENGDAYILGTGTAYEKEGSTFINKTSYIENAETSAVGRALGMCGFGIDASVASAEEVSNAILNQEKKITQVQMQKLSELCTQDDLIKIMKKNNITDMRDLPLVKADQYIRFFEKQEEKQ